jgi:hypothetical protein
MKKIAFVKSTILMLMLMEVENPLIQLKIRRSGVDCHAN